MSDAGKAVFLSYASQDAEAAIRICEALRQAGVEVWFDQSELVGGDAWDGKIRGQISSCALFVPIISAATQARREGYFRIEWKLAAQRTHAMADGTPFLLPLLIDGTHDAEALVPAEFRTVQWTKLPGGETPPVFAERVKKLLGGDVAPVGDRRPGTAPQTDTGQRPVLPRKSRLWLVPVIVMAVLAGIWQQRRNSGKPPVAVPPAVVPAGSVELARVRAQLTPDRWQREDFAAMAPTLDRLIEANPELSDAWAMRSIINSLQVLRNFDSSTKPLEVGKAAADRASRLAPGSPLADIAFGMHLVAMTSRGGDARACRPYLDRGVAALPPDALTRYAELASYWFAYDFEQVQRCGQAWLDAEPQASFPPWIFAQLNVVRRRPGEAEKWAEIAVADPNITGVRAFNTMFESKYYLRADLSAAWATLQRVPPVGRSVHRVVHARWVLALAANRWDDALQELAQVPETFLFDRSYHGPKALLAGLAHQRAGRADAAAAQFREAERLLKEHLASDSDNEELHAVLAVTLACAGRGAEARSELALVEPLVKGRAPSIYRGSLVMTIAQAYAVLGDSGPLAFWLRKLLAEPSQFPFTPASIRVDPRFASVAKAPEIQAMLKEFAALDHPVEQQAAIKPIVDDKSVAVLAFANLSDDKGNEYFSDGISEELLNVLAKIPGLKVSARTSAFYFKGKEVPVPEIARQLGVAYVVEGSVRKSGDKVRITAQLIKAADGFHVWSDTFTRDLKDIFAVQDEIAGLIAQNLSLKLGITASAASAVNPAAYQHMLQARFFSRKEDNEGWRKSIEECRAALALDPDYALAAAEMARSYIFLCRFGGISLSEGFRAARPAAERALALNPELPEANNAMGWVLRTADWDWRRADAAFRRAYELAPRSADMIRDYAVIRNNQGFFAEAIELGRLAVKLDPLNASTHCYASLFLAWFDGHLDEAVTEMQRGLALAPEAVEWHSILARSLILQGRLPEAAATAEREPSERYRLFARALVLSAQKNHPAAEQARSELIEKHGETMSFHIAEIFALSGEDDRAFEWLERARIRGDTPMAWILGTPTLRPLLRDPRWTALIAKLGLATNPGK